MDKGFISVLKVKYTFKDGTEMSGLELSLAPKVKKFIAMNRDNLDLMEMMKNGLAEWYNRANYGDDLILSGYTGKDRGYSPNNDGEIPVHIV